jgi:hypothetical protein
VARTPGDGIGPAQQNNSNKILFARADQPVPADRLTNNLWLALFLSAYEYVSFTCTVQILQKHGQAMIEHGK